MNIFINGQHYDISLLTEQNLQQALKVFLNHQQPLSTFAVALNGEFVDRTHYQQTQLVANDKVDVLFPIQGG